MTIELSKYNRIWRANIKELPGSPPVGEGETQAEAIASLFFHVVPVQLGVDWRVYMDFTKLEIVYVEM